MARLLLRGDELSASLPAAAQRLASALGLPSAAIELAPVEGDEQRVAFPLREGTRSSARCSCRRGCRRRRCGACRCASCPRLEALLAAGLERDDLLGDVVETRALRRTDVVKTALLRAVSHDLRTPLTAILAAAEALASPTLTRRGAARAGRVSRAEARGCRG